MTYSTIATSTNVAADCKTWPDDEQERWRSLFDPTRNRRPLWVRQTQYQNAGVYTRFLECARRHGHSPALCPDAIRAFIAESERSGCAITTISGYLWAIWKVRRKVGSDGPGDLEWFRQTCLNLQQAANETVPQAASRKVDTAEIILGAEKLIVEARMGLSGVDTLGTREPADCSPQVCLGDPIRFGKQLPWDSVQSFRDGLFLLIGALAPERLRALATIRLDQIDFDKGRIHFERQQIKMKRESIRILPDYVLALLCEWLEFWRPAYAKNHNIVWIAKGGGDPCFSTLSVAMKKATERTIGVAVTPHQLRDAAATLAVEESPQAARLASLVLDHRDERITRAYTQQANQIAAGRALAGAIARTTVENEKKVRAMSRSTVALNPRSKRLAA